MKLATRIPQSHAHLAARLDISPRRLIVYSLVALSVFITTLYVRSASHRDPGSWFFDPSVAYKPEYSALRQVQAEEFIAAANKAPPFHNSDDPAPPLCIGIPSIARDGARYLRDTVGSLLAGLTQEEREGIHLKVFIPHTEPSVHPAFREAWLSSFADEILLYNLSSEELEHLVILESDHASHREKGLFDYTYLLKACYATGSPYIAMIEDDVIAMDGWYHRTVDGLLQANLKSALENASGEFLYLRLFYTEEFLGWNGEDWRTHAFWSCAVILGSVALVMASRSLYPDTKRILTPYASVAICLLLIPWAVLLFFAASKVTVLPLPPGVNEMNNYGCCAQGLVFPRHKAHDLIEWFEAQRSGFADMLIEQYANEHGELRWALTPSVLQHVGAKSSKEDDFGHGAKYSKSVAESIWNFAFEKNKPEVLRKEHELAAIEPAALRP